MIAVIAELTIQEGKGADFESVFADLAAQIALHEPGNKQYQLVRSKAEPTSYRIFELYDDAAALELHGKSEHFRAAGQRLAPLLAAAPKIDYFEAV
ncbi:putative quinol monooxygenase [Nocardia bovistercoris]|uniref:Antibiotic biosynthesis monooxygenase n=1 Tax=Nocardia bovistercoris TaxID=2785916 RepID=A0A931IH68_9NOCA|nr:putative quinol monooxygenase [Nocardia bovistercoris]MBH0779583.1 antibiotic biosynthesis monooxygenase [Nocardia bovistercoris]